MENLISPIPEDVADILVKGLHGHKIMVKYGGLKYKGRVTDVAYDGKFVNIKLDHNDLVIPLDMDTYFKVFK